MWVGNQDRLFDFSHISAPWSYNRAEDPPMQMELKLWHRDGSRKSMAELDAEVFAREWRLFSWTPHSIKPPRKWWMEQVLR